MLKRIRRQVAGSTPSKQQIDIKVRSIVFDVIAMPFAEPTADEDQASTNGGGGVRDVLFKGDRIFVAFEREKKSRVSTARTIATDPPSDVEFQNEKLSMSVTFYKESSGDITEKTAVLSVYKVSQSKTESKILLGSAVVYLNLYYDESYSVVHEISLTVTKKGKPVGLLLDVTVSASPIDQSNMDDGNSEDDATSVHSKSSVGSSIQKDKHTLSSSSSFFGSLMHVRPTEPNPAYEKHSADTSTSGSTHTGATTASTAAVSTATAPASASVPAPAPASASASNASASAAASASAPPSAPVRSASVRVSASKDKTAALSVTTTPNPTPTPTPVPSTVASLAASDAPNPASPSQAAAPSAGGSRASKTDKDKNEMMMQIFALRAECREKQLAHADAANQVVSLRQQVDDLRADVKSATEKNISLSEQVEQLTVELNTSKTELMTYNFMFTPKSKDGELVLKAKSDIEEIRKASMIHVAQAAFEYISRQQQEKIELENQNAVLREALASKSHTGVGGIGSLHSSISWEPDARHPTCMICSKSFSLFFRRHHCRVCGGVFCASCSSTRIGQPPVRACLRCTTNA